MRRKMEDLKDANSQARMMGAVTTEQQHTHTDCINIDIYIYLYIHIHCTRIYIYICTLVYDILNNTT